MRNIISMHNKGVPYHEMAILMRLNSLSRAFEEKLLTYNIPHIMYNGFKFFERQEIKNVLAYLTAIVNPDDNVSFQRIINFPKRGIGDASIEKLITIADTQKISLKQVVMNYEIYMLPKALNDKLSQLKSVLAELEEDVRTKGMYEFFTDMLEKSGILKSFDLDNEQEYERYMNINSLVNSVREFEENNQGATIIDYLESVTLSSAMDTDDGKGVVIATVHGSKGLEFDTVFIVGCEEKAFPITRDDKDDIEEERRLMYVAITRARKDLFLTGAQSRFLYGKRDYPVKSRFLYELDLAQKKQINSSFNSYNNYNSNGYNSFSGYNKNTYNKGDNMNTLQSNNNKLFNYTFGKDTVEKKTIDVSKIKVGAKVTHPKFGDGVITEVTPNSSNHAVKIKFEVVGEKMLSLEYAPIEFKD